MVEIIALYYFAKNIGEMVESKGHRSLWYKVMAVAMWFGGEFVGAIIGGILFGPEGGQCAIYLLALLGAAMSAGTVYLIAKNLSPISKSTNYDDMMPLD